MVESIFNFGNNTVRVIENEGGFWFVAVDICRVLELANSRKAIADLDDDEKGVTICDTPGGPQKVGIVNESGLYHLIFKSRKPTARQFRKWVTGTVLPTIRKTGGFQAETRLQKALMTYLEETRPAVEYGAEDDLGRRKTKFRRATFTVGGRKQISALRVNSAMLLIDSILSQPLLPGFKSL